MDGGGSPDTAVTIPGTTNNAWGEALRDSSVSWGGHHDAARRDVGVNGNTGTGRPNPSSITPTTAGAWPVICGGGAVERRHLHRARELHNGLHHRQRRRYDRRDVGAGYRSDWTSGPKIPANLYRRHDRRNRLLGVLHARLAPAAAGSFVPRLLLMVVATRKMLLLFFRPHVYGDGPPPVSLNLGETSTASLMPTRTTAPLMGLRPTESLMPTRTTEAL